MNRRGERLGKADRDRARRCAEELAEFLGPACCTDGHVQVVLEGIREGVDPMRALARLAKSLVEVKVVLLEALITSEEKRPARPPSFRVRSAMKAPAAVQLAVGFDLREVAPDDVSSCAPYVAKAVYDAAREALRDGSIFPRFGGTFLTVRMRLEGERLG